MTKHTRERAELEAVLASTLFTRAPVLSRFLAYVCEQYFRGEAEGIKEYNIAVEVLKRGPDFNPAEDSIVRVQAARLRRHLRRYYETDGSDHTIQIRISPTGYAPQFIEVEHLGNDDSQPDRGAAATPTESAPALESPVRSRLRSGTYAVGLAILLLMAGILAVRAFYWDSPVDAVAGVPLPSEGPGDGSAIRIRCGFLGPRFIDVGGEQWLGDRYFVGGVVVEKPGHPIFRTLDQALYQTAREGDFRYDIPLKKGIYELHLHFAETSFGHGPVMGGETQRIFTVRLNGERLLPGFDITRDAAGSNTAVEKIFTDISPAEDGFLHLEFSTMRGRALLNGIEIIPGVPGRMRPHRIVCSSRPYYDRKGRLWVADQYFAGGRLSELIRPIGGSEDPELYTSYRTGNFTYAIPVARNGSYKVRAHFAEPVWGAAGSSVAPVGRRVFDIYCNGKALVEGLDVYREAAGQNRLIVKTFKGLKPNAQDKLNLSFIPSRDYAVLLALEVIDERL